MYFSKDTKKDSSDFCDLSPPYFYRDIFLVQTYEKIKYGLVRLITVDLTVFLMEYDRIP